MMDLDAEEDLSQKDSPTRRKSEIEDHFAAVYNTPSLFRGAAPAKGDSSRPRTASLEASLAEEEAAAKKQKEKDERERQETSLLRGSNKGDLEEEGANKGKATKAAATKEMTKLVTAIGALTLANAREISNLSACCYQTFLLEPESLLAKSALEGGQFYNEAVKKAKEKDDEEEKETLGAPKNAVFAMMLKGLAQEKDVSQAAKEALKKYWADKFAGKQNFEDCDSDVKFCRATKAKKGNQKVKLQFALADETMEKTISAALMETKLVVQKRGQAPRGPLERMIKKAIEKTK